MICFHEAKQACPQDPCPGRTARDICAHVAFWRRWQIRQDRPAGDADPAPVIDPPRRVRVGLVCPCLVAGGAETWQMTLVGSVDPEQVEWMGAVVTLGESATDSRVVAALACRMPVEFGFFAIEPLARRCDVLLSWADAPYSMLFEALDDRPAIVQVSHLPNVSYEV